MKRKNRRTNRRSRRTNRRRTNRRSRRTYRRSRRTNKRSRRTNKRSRRTNKRSRRTNKRSRRTNRSRKSKKIMKGGSSIFANKILRMNNNLDRDLGYTTKTSTEQLNAHRKHVDSFVGVGGEFVGLGLGVGAVLKAKSALKPGETLGLKSAYPILFAILGVAGALVLKAAGNLGISAVQLRDMEKFLKLLKKYEGIKKRVENNDKIFYVGDDGDLKKAIQKEIVEKYNKEVLEDNMEQTNTDGGSEATGAAAETTNNPIGMAVPTGGTLIGGSADSVEIKTDSDNDSENEDDSIQPEKQLLEKHKILDKYSEVDLTGEGRNNIGVLVARVKTKDSKLSAAFSRGIDDGYLEDKEQLSDDFLKDFKGLSLAFLILDGNKSDSFEGSNKLPTMMRFREHLDKEKEKEQAEVMEQKLVKIANLANVSFAFDACQHKNIVKQVIEKFEDMEDETIKGLIDAIEDDDDY